MNRFSNALLSIDHYRSPNAEIAITLKLTTSKQLAAAMREIPWKDSGEYFSSIALLICLLAAMSDEDIDEFITSFKD